MSDPETPPAATEPVAVIVTTQTSLGDRIGAAWPDLVARWLAAHVANGPIARNTEAYNHLVDVALPALRQALEETT